MKLSLYALLGSFPVLVRSQDHLSEDCGAETLAFLVCAALVCPDHDPSKDYSSSPETLSPCDAFQDLFCDTYVANCTRCTSEAAAMMECKRANTKNYLDSSCKALDAAKCPRIADPPITQHLVERPRPRRRLNDQVTADDRFTSCTDSLECSDGLFCATDCFTDCTGCTGGSVENVCQPCYECQINDDVVGSGTCEELCGGFFVGEPFCTDREGPEECVGELGTISECFSQKPICGNALMGDGAGDDDFFPESCADAQHYVCDFVGEDFPEDCSDCEDAIFDYFNCALESYSQDYPVFEGCTLTPDDCIDTGGPSYPTESCSDEIDVLDTCLDSQEDGVCDLEDDVESLDLASCEALQTGICNYFKHAPGCECKEEAVAYYNCYLGEIAMYNPSDYSALVGCNLEAAACTIGLPISSAPSVVGTVPTVPQGDISPTAVPSTAVPAPSTGVAKGQETSDSKPNILQPGMLLISLWGVWYLMIALW